MFKKVSVLTLVLALSFESAVVYSKPSRKRAGSNKKRFSSTKKMEKKLKTVVEELKTTVAEEQPAVTPASAPVIETNIIDNSVTNDVDAVRAVVKEELQASNQIIANLNKKENEKKTVEINNASSALSQKIEEVRSECSGIKSNIDTIFGLTVATTVSSGLGTAAAGGALAVGLVKSSTDKKIEENNELLEAFKKASASGKEEDIASFESKIDEINELITDGTQEKLNKKSKTLGNVRTGLMAGATVTSAVSTGTSVGAVMNASKLAEKMSSCNKKLSELQIAKNTLVAILEDEQEPAVVATAQNILSVCTGFDEDNIKTLKTRMTASAVVSGIGTATAGAGTVTSLMANKDSVRNDDSEAGKKKEKKLNIASNILAGVTMGTSATSTVLSATSISKAKKDSEMAEKCERAL